MSSRTRPAILAAGVAFGIALTAADAPPVPGQSWTLPLADENGFGLAWIPPGEFTMGSPPGESGRGADESPTTHVTLTHGFWLGKNLVTIGQWKNIMGHGVREQLARRISDETLYEIEGKKHTLRESMHWSRDVDPATYLANESDAFPMYFVSWNDVQEFIKKVNERERAAGRLPAGYAYDLPTEAQWEYACRAGTTGATYAGPNTPAVLETIAWYAGNSATDYSGRRLGPTRSGPRAVGQKKPNAWGLFDMYGNLWQWCRDWYGPYPGGNVTDPTGPAKGTARVNRGGSFGSGASSERSACRAGNPPMEPSAYRGFRLALSVHKSVAQN